MLFANSNSMSIDHRVGYDSLFRKHILTAIELKCCEGIMPPSWIVKVMEGWGERKNVAGKSAGTINSNPALQAMGMMELVHCTRRQCESEHCGYEHGECH